jgi:hypothetical protein
MASVGDRFVDPLAIRASVSASESLPIVQKSLERIQVEVCSETEGMIVTVGP